MRVRTEYPEHSEERRDFIRHKRMESDRRKMSMGIGTNAGTPDAGILHGQQRPVACGVWFTSAGTVMPKLLKFQDEQGIIRTVDHVRVMTAEKKHYCGIPVVEYRCSAEFDGLLHGFRLIYYTERQEWKLLL